MRAYISISQIIEAILLTFKICWVLKQKTEIYPSFDPTKTLWLFFRILIDSIVPRLFLLLVQWQNSKLKCLIELNRESNTKTGRKSLSKINVLDRLTFGNNKKIWKFGKTNLSKYTFSGKSLTPCKTNQVLSVFFDSRVLSSRRKSSDAKFHFFHKNVFLMLNCIYCQRRHKNLKQSWAARNNLIKVTITCVHMSLTKL
ncbi:hypothetical protein BpHYR1_040910 [Brachionus plicatilis]|uniref:Uncharacterized protein n=1 Tax=Brachionus plicatilis TaxID=10195 RepID=A0A3M7QK35_BRAPC|nr:hypothetical protein BpHYR1_040910 [Brachionus plicatilis]